MEDDTGRKPIYFCESCGEPIYAGDMAHIDSEVVPLCADHAPMLSDLVAWWGNDLGNDDEGAWGEFFDSLDEAEEWLKGQIADLAENGDRKLLSAV